MTIIQAKNEPLALASQIGAVPHQGKDGKADRQLLVKCLLQAQ